MRGVVRFVRDRRGASAALFALSVPALVGGLGFAVDGGLIRVDRGRLQSAADAAVLAGAQFSATPSSVAPAAQAMATANMPVEQNGTVLKTSDVVQGTWKASDRSFTVGGANPNAVQVTVRRAAANGNAHTLIFGRFLGMDSIDLSAKAVALTKVTETGCVPDYRFNSAFLPTSTKIVTQGESVQVNGRATYLETADHHPIVRLDNSANGPATVVIKITGAPGGDQLHTFYPPTQGSFRTIIDTITDTAPYPASNIILVFTTVSVSAGVKGGGTSTWTNNIRTVATLPGTCVPIAGAVGAGVKTTATLVG